jgi:hypothetical protein
MQASLERLVKRTLWPLCIRLLAQETGRWWKVFLGLFIKTDYELVEPPAVEMERVQKSCRNESDRRFIPPKRIVLLSVSDW